jgi:hypothetical protein
MYSNTIMSPGTQVSFIFNLLSMVIYILMSYFHTKPPILFRYWPSVLGHSVAITVVQPINAVET